MAASVIFGVAVLLGCASAIPTPTISSCSSSCSSTTVKKSCTRYSFFQNFYESSYTCSYVDVGTCSSIGINTLYNRIPKLIIEDLEREYLQAKCNILEKYSVFPEDLGSIIHKLNEEQLRYEYVILGSSPSALFTLEKLAANGYRCLVIDSGLLPPTYSSSQYIKWSLLGSQYVKPYPGTCGKHYYVSNVWGGYSVFAPDQFDYGCEHYYRELSKYDKRISWEQAQQYYKSFSSQQTTTKKETKTEVSRSSCGCLRVSTTVRETSVVRNFKSVFTELGYGDCGVPLTCGCKGGFYSVPRLVVDDEDDSFLPYYIFKKIKCYDNVRILTGCQIEKLVYESGRVCGVEVITESGRVVIRNEKDIILGMDSIELAKVFYKSGFGPSSVLSSLGLPCLHPIENLAKHIQFSPVYTGSYMLFEQGFITEFEDDYTCYSSIFSSSSVSASTYQAAYSAYLSVGNCDHSNVKLQLYSFNYRQKRMLEVFMRNYAQYSDETCKYFLDLICKHDIVFFAIHLLEYQSKGSLVFKDCLDTPVINFGFYEIEQDRRHMIEAIKLAQKFAATKAIQGYGGQINLVPISSCKASPFSDEYIIESLSQHTIPGYNSFSAFSFGSDIKTSVLDINLRPYNMQGLCVMGPATSPYPWFSDSIALSSFFSNHFYERIVSVSSSSTSVSTGSSSATTAVTRELEVSKSSGTDVIGGDFPLKPGCGCDEFAPPCKCKDIDVTPGCGDVIPGCGDVIPGCGDVIPGCGDVIPGCGDVIPGCGDVIPGCGGIPSDCSGVDIASGVSAASYEATELREQSSSYDSSSIIGNAVGSSASSYESEYVSAANESAQVIAGGAGGVASQYSNSEYEAKSTDFEQTVHGAGCVSKVEQESKSVSSSTVESSCLDIPCGC